MVTDFGLAALVADKIRSGALPVPPEPPHKYFAGKGTGTLRIHEKCLDMWRQARG
jgi:hypothetical protein